MRRIRELEERLRPKRRFGKYRLVRRLGRGGFAEVWQAFDTVQQISVAMKVPLRGRLTPREMRRFQRETRLTASLDHPNIAGLKNAEFIDDLLVAVYPLGRETLADRMTRRVGTPLALQIADDLLAGLAHAHARGIIHCDVKPENVLLFSRGQARLCDFGISKLAARTIASGSGSGTVGYFAPEQAFGRPSRKSDVFSAGLVIWRLLSGQLPKWPFLWPLPGARRIEERAGLAVLRVLRRSLHVHSQRRFKSAHEMLAAWRVARLAR
jgi:serine/threonine-protein kinase